MINRLIVAFITSSSNLVPLLEGLCSSNPCRFEFSILSFCRNRTNDLAVDSPVLWPTKQVLHRLGQWWWWAIMGPRPDYRRFQVNHTFDGPLRLNGKTRNREIAAGWAVGVRMPRRDYGSEFRHGSPSSNQHQMLIDCLCCHIYCPQLGAPWCKIIGGSNASF